MLIDGVRNTILILNINMSSTYNNDLVENLRTNLKTSYLFTFLIVLVALLFTKRYIHRKLTKIMVKQDEYRIITEETMRAIAKTIDANDPYTKGHSYRVAYYSVEIAKRLNMDKEEIERIHYIALMHDIGKIGIPNTILQKPKRLTEEEYEIVKRHPIIGGEILQDITHIKDIVVGAVYHHEHYDGTGYPKGLKGNDIPLVARIIGVADSYDTMISDRPYRRGMPKEEIVRELIRCSGTQFDPNLVTIMVDIIRESLNQTSGSA